MAGDWLIFRPRAGCLQIVAAAETCASPRCFPSPCYSFLISYDYGFAAPIGFSAG